MSIRLAMSVGIPHVSPGGATAIAFAALVVIALFTLGVTAMWGYFAVRREVRRTRPEWEALARTRGFEVEQKGNKLAMRGRVAGCPFELDPHVFLGYGMDAELGLRVRIADAEATCSMSAWVIDRPYYGELQPPTGDTSTDAKLKVRANAAGLRYVARLGPIERQLLVEHDEICVLLSRSNVVIRLPYTLDAEHLDVACRLVACLFGPDARDADSRASTSGR